MGPMDYDILGIEIAMVNSRMNGIHVWRQVPLHRLCLARGGALDARIGRVFIACRKVVH